MAAKKGHELLVGLLLTAKAVADVKDCRGDTPLHLCSQFGYVECCRKLTVDINAVNEDKRTCLHLSAFNGSAECVDFLIASGASSSMLDKYGRLPLHYAASRAWFDCIFTLVSSGK